MKFPSLFLAVLALAGCAVQPNISLPTRARFFLETTDKPEVTLTLPKSGSQVGVRNQPVIMEYDFTNVELAKVELGQCLMFQLTPTATRDLYRMTGSNQGKRLVLGVDGAPIGARLIDGAITDGKIYIFAEVPDAVLPDLVERLKKAAVTYQKKSS